MDKLRAQYALHKKYRTISTNNTTTNNTTKSTSTTNIHKPLRPTETINVIQTKSNKSITAQNPSSSSVYHPHHHPHHPHNNKGKENDFLPQSKAFAPSDITISTAAASSFDEHDNETIEGGGGLMIRRGGPSSSVEQHPGSSRSSSRSRSRMMMRPGSSIRRESSLSSHTIRSKESKIRVYHPHQATYHTHHHPQQQQQQQQQQPQQQQQQPQQQPQQQQQQQQQQQPQQEQPPEPNQRQHQNYRHDREHHHHPLHQKQPTHKHPHPQQQRDQQHLPQTNPHPKNPIQQPQTTQQDTVVPTISLPQHPTTNTKSVDPTFHQPRPRRKQPNHPTNGSLTTTNDDHDPTATQIQNNHGSSTRSKDDTSVSVTSSDTKQRRYNRNLTRRRMRMTMDVTVDATTAKSYPPPHDPQPPQPPQAPQHNPILSQNTTLPYSVLIPTEAQLRWAQFQLKNRGEITRSRVQSLMQTPMLVEDVEGAISGDGDSSSSDCASLESEEVNDGSGNSITTTSIRDRTPTTKRKKKKKKTKTKTTKKTRISRGRRALLRVSARNTLQRSLHIQNQGYAMAPDTSDTEYSFPSGQYDPNSLSYNPTSTSYGGAGAGGAGAGGSRKKRSSHHRPRPHRIVSNADEDEERLLRFEAAYRTMCAVAVLPEEVGVGELMRAEKRWSRGHVPVAVSIDGRVYMDMQRSPAERVDRDRFWGVDRQRLSVSTDGEEGCCGREVSSPDHHLSLYDGASPAKLKLMEIVSRLSMSASCMSSPTVEVAREADDTHRRTGWTSQQHEKQDSIQEEEENEVKREKEERREKEEKMSVKTKGKSPVVTTADMLRIAVERRISSPILANVDVKGLRDRFLKRSLDSENGSDNGKSSDNALLDNNSNAYDINCDGDSTELKDMDDCQINETKVFGVASRYIRGLRGNQMEPTQNQDSNTNDTIANFGSNGLRSSTLEQIDKSSSHHNSNHIQGKITKMVQQRSQTAQSKPSHPIIDTDANTIITEGMDPSRVTHIMQTLLLSPAILTKRLNQAIRAVETHNWDQVSYLLSANPWLAEMPDVTTNQYLLHKLASYGGNRRFPAGRELNEDLISAFPAIVHKFDNDGNLPLHMAAAAGNEWMVKRLGEMFESGASVRNNEGLLPLHLAILKCATWSTVSERVEGDVSSSVIIKMVLDMFPGALVVEDNDGNLPLHLAATRLKGDLGMQVVYILAGEAEKLGHDLRLPSGIKKLEEDAEESVITQHTTGPLQGREDSSTVIGLHDGSCILFAKNSYNLTPLMCAVKNRAGWQVIEALLNCPGTDRILFDRDNEHNQTILHLAIGDEGCCDPLSIVSILKAAPRLATIPSIDGGILPIEAACMGELPPEVIMAIALVDLPIDLDGNDTLASRDGYGASWWYLTCDCDDAYVSIVKEIMVICTYPQKRRLCFLKSEERGGSVIKRASPKCKLELRKALRFAGRYEFTGNSVVKAESVKGIKVFEVLDFGPDDKPIEDGRIVYLKYYAQTDTYERETRILRSINLECNFISDIRIFGANALESNVPDQLCLAVERHKLTLSKIVPRIEKEDNDSIRTHNVSKYVEKIQMVLFQIAKGIEHLHNQGVVHGRICLDACGKFEKGWKLTDLIGVQFIGHKLPLSRYSNCAPPEAVQVLDGSAQCDNFCSRHTLCETMTATESLDIWAFGSLMYEALVGKPIFETLELKDTQTILKLGTWDDDNLRYIIAKVETCGIGTIGADLISHCLCPHPEDRPKSMGDIIGHPFWKTVTASRSRRGNRCLTSMKFAC